MDLSQLYMLEMMRKRRLADTFPAYRTDDLVLMLDGIKNQRTGGHNPSATVWEDLAGNMDVTLFNATWGADYVQFLGDANSYGVGTTWNFTSGTTIEIVFRPTADLTPVIGKALVSFGYNGPVTNNTFLLATSQYLRLFMSSNTNIGTGVPVNQISYTGFTSGILNQDGNTITHAQTAVLGPSIAKFTLAGLWSDSSKTGMHKTFPLHGRIYAVRVYDANLTAEELYAHWLIDKARFNIPEA